MTTMRLLQRASDGSLSFAQQQYIKEDEVPKYAVLSHTWFTDAPEVNFDDIRNGKAVQKPKSYAKIQFCADQAAKDGLKYFWVDTCCIDRDSSADVQYAINTMFQWYQKSTRCYALLADVHTPANEVADLTLSPRLKDVFRNSRWFTRGWTLQELLAPRTVEFFTAEGTRIGDKHSLENYIHEITGIPLRAIEGDDLISFKATERLSWVEKRNTTRPEDKAYCLLGIFSVFMPLIYGEGEKNALDRLREEISKDKNAERTRLREALKTLPTTSAAAFNSAENQHLSMCLDHTRAELLTDIEDWASRPDAKCIFWLNGTAGTGKSTIARTVARKFLQLRQSQGSRCVLGGSFFFSKGGGGANNANYLFTTLASQLAELSFVTDQICHATREQKDLDQLSIRDQWDELIVRPLSNVDHSITHPIIVIVIDALDECDNEDAVNIIIRLLASSKQLSNLALRIFITSRPEVFIRSGFQDIPQAERSGIVLQDVPRVEIERDLRYFFENELRAIREQRELGRDWPGSRRINQLVDMACGLFIWASTASRYIRDGKGLAESRLTRLINGRSDIGPYKRLDEIYNTVLKDSVNEDYDDEEKDEVCKRLRMVLGSIVTLFAPLSIEGLAKLLGIETSDVGNTLADLHTILNIPRQKTKPVGLHHPSFRDFLLSDLRCNDKDFWIDEKEAHTILARSCVRLMSESLGPNLCELPSPGSLIENVKSDWEDWKAWKDRCIPPELEYACLHWAEHLRQGGAHLADDDDTHQFFQVNFLHWLEALSLLERGSEMAHIIREYQSLLDPAYNSRQIPFVKDSRRFIFAFHSIIEQAPLQTYCAALVFIPPSNELREHYRSKIHKQIEDVRVVEADAPPAKDEYNYVSDLAFSPGGHEIASGCLHPWVRVWDVATLETRAKFTGQKDKISSVAISPDGSMLASGSDDTTVMVWDWKRKEIRYKSTAHSRWVNSVKFSPNGKYLASGSMDETIRIYNAASGQELKVLAANSSCVNSIAFSPDSLLIASGAVNQMIHLWNIEKGKVHFPLDGHAGPVNCVQFSPDGRAIVSGSDDMTVRIRDVATRSLTKTLRGHTKKVWAVTFSPDASRIASGSEDQTIRLWDLRSGHLLKVLVGHTSGINSVVYAPGSGLFASGSFDDEIWLWDAVSETTRGTFADFEDVAGSISHLASPISTSVLAKSLDHIVSTGNEARGHSAAVTCLVFSTDGQWIASGSEDSTLKLWTPEGSPRSELEGHSHSITHLAVSPDSTVLASSSMDATVRLWNPTTGTIQRILEGHSDTVNLVRFSSDGSLLACCAVDGTVRLCHVQSGAVLQVFAAHSGKVNDIAFSPDSRHIASCSEDQMIHIWNTRETTESPTTIKAHAGPVTSIAFANDGSRLVSSSRDKTIKIWDTSGTLQTTLVHHGLQVTCAAFSQNIEQLVSSAEDGTVIVWDLTTETPLNTLNTDIVVSTVRFSASGSSVETDRGVLNITSPSDPPSHALPQQPSSPLFVAREWVRCGSQNLLWLRQDYRPISVANKDDRIVLGHLSGAISFLKLKHS